MFAAISHVCALVFESPGLRRAKESVVKKTAFVQRPKLFLMKNQVHEIMGWCQENEEYMSYGILCLLVHGRMFHTGSLPTSLGPTATAPSHDKARPE